jgi:Mn2+/Fe2+ NRAMP family transporter
VELRPFWNALDPIKALYWSAVINGVVAPLVMALMMLVVRRKKVMGESQAEGWLYGWAGLRQLRWAFRSSAWSSLAAGQGGSHVWLQSKTDRVSLPP